MEALPNKVVGWQKRLRNGRLSCIHESADHVVADLRRAPGLCVGINAVDIDVADSGSDSDNDADGHFHKRSNTCGGGGGGGGDSSSSGSDSDSD